MTAGDVAPRTGVATYRGMVEAASLGRTLMHEHLFVRSPELDVEHPHPEWHRQAAVAEAVAVLTGLHDLGIGAVVDLTVPGLGRDAALVAEVADQVEVDLVAATGWYTDDVLPPFFRTHGPGRLVGGPDPLEQLFRRDVEEGIGDTGVRAGVIKVVTDAPGMTPDVTRVMEAAVRVHLATGVPVTTHSNPREGTGLVQARYLTERGVDPRHVVIGHCGDHPDLDHLLAIADTGVTLGVDRFGMTHTGSDEVRMEVVVALVERGLAGQLVLSHDSAVFSRVTPPSWRRRHTPEWRPDHLSLEILPRLRERGVTDAHIDTMTIDNPRRILAPTRSEAA